MEKLHLSAFLALDELYIVYQQHVDVPVFVFEEPHFAVVVLFILDSFYEL